MPEITVTMINTKTSENKMPKKKYAKMAKALKAKVKTQARG